MKKLVAALLIAAPVVLVAPSAATACGCCCCCGEYYDDYLPLRDGGERTHQVAAPYSQHEYEPRVVIFTGEDYKKFTSWAVGWIAVIIVVAVVIYAMWLIAGALNRGIDIMTTPKEPAEPNPDHERRANSGMDFMKGL